MSVLLCVWNHQRGELTSFKLHFYGSWHAPHTLFSCWLIRKFPWMQWYIFKTHFPGKLMCSCFLSSTNRPYCRWLALIQKYLITCFSGFSEIFATYCMNVIAVILLKSKVKWKGGGNNIVLSKSWSWKIFLQVLHLKTLFVMGLKSHFLPVCFYLRVLTFYHVFLFKFQN